MNKQSPSSSIHVKFLKKPKILKPVLLPGFDPIESTKERKPSSTRSSATPSHHPPPRTTNNQSKDDTIQFNESFFSEEPEEIMSIPDDLSNIQTYEQYLDDAEIEAESKNVTEEDADVEEDFLTEEIEKLGLSLSTNLSSEPIRDEDEPLSKDDRLPIQHIKPTISKSLIDNYHPTISSTESFYTSEQNNSEQAESNTSGKSQGSPENLQETESEDISNDVDPDIHLDEWQQKALEFAEHQQYPQALQYFDRILYIQPTNYLIHEYKAQIYLELGMFLQAIQAIESSIECNPSWYVSHLTKARCQREMGELELAYESYQHVYAIYREQHNDPSLENDAFFHELNQEIEDLRNLLQTLQQKQQYYHELMERSVSEESEEVNRCFYHLSKRARSRKQIEFLSQISK